MKEDRSLYEGECLPYIKRSVFLISRQRSSYNEYDNLYILDIKEHKYNGYYSPPYGGRDVYLLFHLIPLFHLPISCFLPTFALYNNHKLDK